MIIFDSIYIISLINKLIDNNKQLSMNSGFSKCHVVKGFLIFLCLIIVGNMYIFYFLCILALNLIF